MPTAEPWRGKKKHRERFKNDDDLTFLYRLAETCGEADVQALLARLTPEQLDQWEAFDANMPLGIDRICWTLAKLGMEVCALLSSDPAKTFAIKDFMPWLSVEPDEQTPEQQITICRMIAGGA